jgi:hypothetical protein
MFYRGVEMEIQEQRPGTISAIIQLGNPVFIILAVVLPNAALGVAMAIGSLMLLNYVHIMTGALWTGIDLFMGFVIGPLSYPKIPSGLDSRHKAESSHHEWR